MPNETSALTDRSILDPSSVQKQESITAFTLTSRVVPFLLVLAAPFGWLEREQRDVIEFLEKENRALRAVARPTDAVEG